MATPNKQKTLKTIVQMKNQEKREDVKQNNDALKSDHLGIMGQVKLWLVEAFDAADEENRVLSKAGKRRQRIRRAIIVALIATITLLIHFVSSPDRWILRS